MNKRIGLVVAGLGAAALMAGGTAYAASSASSAATTNSSTTIYGCYDSGGNLKVNLPLGTTTCPKGYSALDWNQTGPAGPPGAGATVTPILAGSGSTNCPNGGAEIQDGNPADAPAYACNGTNGSNGTNGTNGSNGSNAAPEYTWTVVCTPNPPGTPGSGGAAGGCEFLKSTTSVPAGTVVTAVGLTVSGGCSAADGNVPYGIAAGTPLDEFNGVQVGDFSSDLFASDFGWGSSEASENLSGPITIPSASQLVVTVNDDCTEPVTVTFTFDLTQPFS